MKTVTITDIKQKGLKSLSSKEPIFLINKNKPKKVIIETDEYEMFLDMLDVIEIQKDMLENPDQEYIPWEQVKKELDIED